MGACVGKCYSFPPPNSSDPNLRQKLVDLSNSSEPEESKFSASPALSSLLTSSSSSPSPSPSPSDSSSSSSSTRSSSGEEEHRHKESSAPPQPKKHGSTKPKPSYRPSGLPPKQPVTRKNYQSIPAKRGRSSSPTPAGAGRKSTARNENSSVVPLPVRKSISSPSSAAAHRRSRSVELQCRQVPHARKENVRPPSPARSSTGRRSWSSEREATLRHNRHGQGSREISSSSQITSRFPLKEDLNNPLIAMDCFIFL